MGTGPLSNHLTRVQVHVGRGTSSTAVWPVESKVLGGPTTIWTAVSDVVDADRVLSTSTR